MKRSLQKGFTIIELIFVIAILTIVITVSYGSIGQILKTKQVLDNERDARAVLNAILFRFSREFEMAKPGYALLRAELSKQSGWGTRWFIGEPKTNSGQSHGDSIYFILDQSDLGTSGSTLLQVGYYVEEDPKALGTYVLYREEVPYKRPAEKAYEKLSRYPIARNVTSLHFRYFDKNKKEWYEDWGTTQRSQLPSAIEYSISLKTPEGSIQSFTGAVAVQSK